MERRKYILKTFNALCNGNAIDVEEVDTSQLLHEVVVIAREIHISAFKSCNTSSLTYTCFDNPTSSQPAKRKRPKTPTYAHHYTAIIIPILPSAPILVR